MQLYLRSILLVFICALAVSTARAASAVPFAQSVPATPGFCDAQSDPGWFKQHAKPRYARGFEVSYGHRTKRVVVRQPWKGAAQEFVYTLVCPGVALEAVAGQRSVQIPTRRMAALSTTYMGQIALLRAEARLAGVKNPELVQTESVKERLADGRILGLGSGAAVDVERLVRLEPDLVMTFAMGDPTSDLHPAIERLRLPVVLNGEYLETTPLGRAEWIMFLAYFLDQEREAAEIFSTVEREYLRLSGLARAVRGPRPTVMGGSPYGDTWWVPGGDGYIGTLFRDAGGEYIFADKHETVSVALQFEAVLRRGAPAQVWIMDNADPQQLAQQEPRIRHFASVQTGEIYSARARADYWESGLANPQVLLADTIRVLHPQLLPTHELQFLRRSPITP